MRAMTEIMCNKIGQKNVSLIKFDKHNGWAQGHVHTHHSLSTEYNASLAYINFEVGLRSSDPVPIRVELIFKNLDKIQSPKPDTAVEIESLMKF